MSVSVSIGKELNKPKQNLIRLELNIRKALNGDLMIFDHGDIDIVLSISGTLKDLLKEMIHLVQYQELMITV